MKQWMMYGLERSRLDGSSSGSRVMTKNDDVMDGLLWRHTEVSISAVLNSEPYHATMNKDL
jgi:hypothetical protein